ELAPEVHRERERLGIARIRRGRAQGAERLRELAEPAAEQSVGEEGARALLSFRCLRDRGARVGHREIRLPERRAELGGAAQREAIARVGGGRLAVGAGRLLERAVALFPRVSEG